LNCCIKLSNHFYCVCLEVTILSVKSILRGYSRAIVKNSFPVMMHGETIRRLTALELYQLKIKIKKEREYCLVKVASIGSDILLDSRLLYQMSQMATHWTDNPAFFNKSQDCEFIKHSGAVAIVDSFLCPLSYIQIPHWAVISAIVDMPPRTFKGIRPSIVVLTSNSEIITKAF
jgi:hypothetical protein